jgi:hypothetical protein
VVKVQTWGMAGLGSELFFSVTLMVKICARGKYFLLYGSFSVYSFKYDDAPGNNSPLPPEDLA